MQHVAHVWQTYTNHVAPAPPPRDDLLAFPKTSLRYLGLREDVVPPSGEVLDEQVNRLVASVPRDSLGASERIEEIRRNATIVRAYVLASLDKQSGGWSSSSLEEDETNYSTLEAKKEELERALEASPFGAQEQIVRKLREVTRRRDETKAKYIASLSKEIMKVARATMGRATPDGSAASSALNTRESWSSWGSSSDSLAASLPSPTRHSELTAPTIFTPANNAIRPVPSFASMSSQPSENDLTQLTHQTTECDGLPDDSIDVLDLSLIHI